MYMDIHTCGERRPSMYRQWMNERLRNEERENGEKEKREGASLGAVRVLWTHVQLGSPQPHLTTLLPEGDPPNGPTKKKKAKKSQQKIISL